MGVFVDGTELDGLELVVIVGPSEGLTVGVFVDGTELGTSLATSVG